MRGWQTITTVAALLASAVFVARDNPAADAGAFLSASGGDDFEIIGRPVDGLNPGTTRRIEVSVRNPQRHAIRVLSIRARVVATSIRGCRPISSNLVVRPYQGRLPVVVDGQDRLTLGYFELFMPPSVTDACRNVVFTIKFSGVAEQPFR